MADFYALIYYPGVMGKTSVDYAHPVLVDMAELSLDPYAQPGNTTHQGTPYHFPVTGDTTGNDPKLHSTTHWHRAWRTVGFGSVRFQGSFQIATQAGRESNATAYTPEVPFDFTLSSSINGKAMHDSITIGGGGTYPVASVAHVGDAGGGSLVTNMNATDPLGTWLFPGITDTPTIVQTVDVTAWNAYDANAPEEGEEPNPDITVQIVADISVSVTGNSSVLRYVDEDDNWQYVSVFVLTISAQLRLDEALPSGYFLDGPDGTQNPDVFPDLQPNPITCSTWLNFIGEDTTTASEVGDATFTSTESLSPDPKIYQSTITLSMDVPWDENGGTPTTVQLGIWSGLIVTFTDPEYATPPAIFP